MYELFYNLFMDNNLLGGASEFAATEILARYLSYGCTIAIFVGIIILSFSVFGILKKIFKG